MLWVAIIASNQLGDAGSKFVGGLAGKARGKGAQFATSIVRRPAGAAYSGAKGTAKFATGGVTAGFKRGLDRSPVRRWTRGVEADRKAKQKTHEDTLKIQQDIDAERIAAQKRLQKTNVNVQDNQINTEVLAQRANQRKVKEFLEGDSTGSETFTKMHPNDLKRVLAGDKPLDPDSAKQLALLEKTEGLTEERKMVVAREALKNNTSKKNMKKALEEIGKGEVPKGDTPPTQQS